jgi:hypothetical protein
MLALVLETLPNKKSGCWGHRTRVPESHQSGCLGIGQDEIQAKQQGAITERIIARDNTQRTVSIIRLHHVAGAACDNFGGDASEKNATSLASGRSSSSAPAPAPAPKLRSCVVCRTRKVRCDKLSPCSNCRRANIAPSTDRPPRWARRLERVANNAASNAQASKDTDAAAAQVMERLRNLESLVKELSGQLEQANAAASSAAGGSSGVTPSERHAFLFRHNLSPSAPDLREFHPLPSPIPFLLDIFSEKSIPSSDLFMFQRLRRWSAICAAGI